MSTDQRKRILLISYYFPPIGGPHSVRWVYLVDSLAKAGFALDVLTINPAAGYVSLDHSLLFDLPSTVTTHRVFPGPLHQFLHSAAAARYLSPTRRASRTSWGPFPFSRLRRFAREAIASFLIPDTMVEWVPWALRKGFTLLRSKKFDLILSSAHPVCDHIVGYFLKGRARVPWICFYSDPWSFYACREVSWPRQAMEKHVEAKLLQAADHVLVPTEEAKTGFLQTFPFLTSHHISLVPAGADLTAYAVSVGQQQHSDRFRLVYTGTFYDRVREPFAFYEALQQVEDLNLEVIFAGHILTQHRDAAADSQVNYLEYQERQQCVALQKSADVLLFFDNVSTTQLPSKVFEYFAAARPILSIEPLPNSRASQLIQAHRRGMGVPNAPEAIATAIRELHTLWKENRLTQAFDVSSLPEFSWEKSGNQLIRTVQAVLAHG